jgi:Etoposide-induced protein 2.4 (EI24)
VSQLIDAFWRAAAYCLHPRVILLSLAPLLLAGGLTLALGYFYWEPAVAGMRATLEGWSLIEGLLKWLESIGGSGLRALIAPLVIVALALPVIVIVSLLMVALFMAPALVSLVVKRRFADLEAKRGAAFWQSMLWSLGCTLAALLALMLSMPLWFVPPMVLLLPPLIWGWLTCRVMAFDVLAEHASVDERRTIMREHRWPLLAIGLICGYLGAAPTLLWAVGAAALIFAPLLILVSVWLYTLVFAFAALWFAHYALAALQRLRQAAATVSPLHPPSLEALSPP